jgi:rfaE bifunctional protein kinase chain/domain
MLKKIKNINVLVAGDIMLDHYVCGEVERISPEAPVPVLRITKEYYDLGGCGNVIRNMRQIGANITCIAAIGNDVAGKIILDKLKKLDVKTKFVVREETTTTKTRFIANNGNIQMFRADKEDIKNVNLNSFDLDNEYDIIIISDYAKGMVTSYLMGCLKKLNIPIIVDPKPKNMWLYKDVFMITPNKKEYDEICISETHPFANGIRYILKTMGKEGMELMKEGEKICSVDTIPVDVYNVTGAGDTVVAMVGLSLALGLDVESSIKVANKCAQYVVTQPGTATVPKKLFEDFVKEFSK